MTPAAALAELRAAGVAVVVRPDGTVGLTAAVPPPPGLLAAARAHRGAIAALLREAGGVAPAPVPPLAPPVPGVPAAWCEGVARLAILPPPEGIPAARWAALAASSARLLRDHGAELHAVGWDALDLFGLHRRAPAANPSGWGLAWLLGGKGEVLDVAPDAVGMRLGPGGARLTYRHPAAAARAETVPAWELGAEPAP